MRPPILALTTLLATNPAPAQTVRPAPPPDPPSHLHRHRRKRPLRRRHRPLLQQRHPLLLPLPPSAGLPAPIAWIDRQLDAGFGPGSTRWGLSFGQNLYTPQDKYINPPNPRDRPYAAHLYTSLTLDRTTATAQTIAELQLGVVGPSALGEEVQNNYHRLIRVRRLDGWDSQLRDEPTANLLVERRWRIPTGTGTVLGLDTELLPSAVATLGNVAVYAGVGGTARIGQGLDADWGPAPHPPRRRRLGLLPAHQTLRLVRLRRPRRPLRRPRPLPRRQHLPLQLPLRQQAPLRRRGPHRRRRVLAHHPHRLHPGRPQRGVLRPERHPDLRLPQRLVPLLITPHSPRSPPPPHAPRSPSRTSTPDSRSRTGSPPPPNPCSAGPDTTKSAAGSPGPLIFGRIPA